MKQQLLFSAELKCLLFQLSIQIYPIPFTKGRIILASSVKSNSSEIAFW